jgi:hypothetical protein
VTIGPRFCVPTRSLQPLMSFSVSSPSSPSTCGAKPYLPQSRSYKSYGQIDSANSAGRAARDCRPGDSRRSVTTFAQSPRPSPHRALAPTNPLRHIMARWSVDLTRKKMQHLGTGN